MITFKQFLTEGGSATAKFKTERANKEDIEKALDLVGRTLNLPDIKDRVLGSVNLTLSGKKEDSGDIDIVISTEEMNVAKTNAKMMELVKGEGTLNKGTKIGSYAVNVGEKKVQVDLMFVTSKDWAKFIFHSQHGDGSNYPGAVRNLILMAVARHKQEPGKDFLVKVDGEVVARASRALKLDTGLERLFKAAKYDKETRTFNKSMDKMDPGQLAMHAETITGKKIKFNPDPEIINDPDKVAEWLFGQGTKAAELMTAEQVIALVKKLPKAKIIIDDAKSDLKKAKLPIPVEME